MSRQTVNRAHEIPTCTPLWAAVCDFAVEGSNNSEGSTLYVTASPCIECSKLIIQSGIKRVVYAEKYRLTDGVDLLKRAGVVVEYMNPDEEEASQD